MRTAVLYVYICRQGHTQFKWCRLVVLSFILPNSSRR